MDLTVRHMLHLAGSTGVTKGRRGDGSHAFPAPENGLHSFYGGMPATLTPRSESVTIRSMAAEQATRALIESLKEERGGCEDCGITYAKVRRLNWHHRNPEQKKFTISDAYDKTASISVEDIIEEIEKCALLCSGCHGRRHNGIPLRENEIDILVRLRDGM